MTRKVRIGLFALLALLTVAAAPYLLLGFSIATDLAREYLSRRTFDSATWPEATSSDDPRRIRTIDDLLDQF